MIGRGHSIPEIAEKLFRSQKTIETHRQSLGRKLGVSNRVELARIAIQMGLAPLDTGRASSGQSRDDYRHRLTGDVSAADAVSRIESACASVVGQACCRVLAERLPQVLDTAGAAVFSLTDEDCRTGRSVVIRHRDAWLDEMRMDLSIAPCRETVAQGFYVLQRDVAERYTELVSQLPFPLHSYMGVRLDDPATGEPVGVLFIFQDHPIDFDEAAETVLRVCAVRAGAELGQMRLIDSLQRSVQTLEERLVKYESE